MISISKLNSSKSLIFIFTISALASLIVLIICSFLQPLSEDEGVFLTIANQINKGFLPYADYFDHKPPGIYYFFALVIGVVGNSLLFARLAIALINLATVYLLFKIGSKFLTEFQRYYLLLIFGILCILYQGFYVLTEPLMVFFLVFSFFVLIKIFEKTSNLLVFICGILIGIATIFKQPAILNAVATGFVIYYLPGYKVKQKKLLILLVFFTGLIVPWTFPLIYFGSEGIIVDSINQIFIINITSYNPDNFYTYLKELPFLILPVLTFLPLLGLAAKNLFTRFKNDTKVGDRIVFLSFVMIIAGIPAVFFRPYHHYWLQIVPFIALIIASQLKLLQQALSSVKFLNLSLIYMMILSFVPILSALIFAIETKNVNYPKLLEQNLIVSKIKSAKHEPVKIYIYSQSAGYYFLTNTNPPDKFFYKSDITADKFSIDYVASQIANYQPDFVIWDTGDKNLTNKILPQNYKIENEFPKTGVSLFKKSISLQ